jgi:hypothetical protein
MHIYLIPIHQPHKEQNGTYKNIFHISTGTNMRAMWNISIKWQRRNYFWISITLIRLFTLNFFSLFFFLAINWKFINRNELAIRAYTRFTRTKCVSCSSHSLLFTHFFGGNFFLENEMNLWIFVWLSGSRYQWLVLSRFINTGIMTC